MLRLPDLDKIRLGLQFQDPEESESHCRSSLRSTTPGRTDSWSELHRGRREIGPHWVELSKHGSGVPLDTNLNNINNLASRIYSNIQSQEYIVTSRDFGDSALVGSGVKWRRERVAIVLMHYVLRGFYLGRIWQQGVKRGEFT